jgi:hypothetical protein
MDWLDYPYPRAGSEGLILYESLIVKHGGDLYGPITSERFISGPYPPVYYWLAAAVLPSELPDFSAQEKVWPVFLPGRIISLLAALLTAALIPFIVLTEGRYTHKSKQIRWLAAAGGAIGGALFLTLPQVTVWATRFRGDMLMLALTAAGLACVAWGSSYLRGPEFGAAQEPTTSDEGRKNNSKFRIQNSKLLIAALFFALAFYTKQTAIAGPVAAGLYLLLRDWRSGLKWCGVMAALVLVPFAILEVVTGHWFYLKMVDYHSLPLSRSTLTRLLQFAFLEDQWPIILPAVCYVLYGLAEWWRARRRGVGSSVPMLIPLFVLVSLAMLPTAAVVGADHNHLLVPGLAICLGVGALAAHLLTNAEWGMWNAVLRFRWIAALSTLVLLATYALFTSAPSSWYNADLTLPPPEVQEQMRAIINNARQNPGPLLFSDDPGIVALAGKETPFDDPFTMTALAGKGRWDESAFHDMLRGGKFGLLVLSCNVPEAPERCRSDVFSPGLMDAVSAGYELQYRDVLFTYRSRVEGR